MLEAVKQNGMALQYVCEELRKDRDVVLEAVKQNGSALVWASEELRKDRDVVLAAVAGTAAHQFGPPRTRKMMPFSLIPRLRGIERESMWCWRL